MGSLSRFNCSSLQRLTIDMANFPIFNQPNFVSNNHVSLFSCLHFARCGAHWTSGLRSNPQRAASGALSHTKFAA